MGAGHDADRTEKQRTLTGRLYGLAKPTVAALPGAAAGAGLSIALACDLRVAADDAIMITAFRNVGLSGDYGATWFLPRLVGLARAKSLFYFSPRLTAGEALSMGLVDRVFPAATFRDDALQYAVELANGPTLTLGRLKQNLQRGLTQSLDESLALEARHMIETSLVLMNSTANSSPRVTSGQNGLSREEESTHLSTVC